MKTNIKANLRRPISFLRASLPAVTAAIAFGVMPGVAHSQIFVSAPSSTIGEYTTSGATVNVSLISGLISPFGIAISGNDLFVANSGVAGIGSIGEYTTSGATVNASLVAGLISPYGMAICGDDLFVANNGNNTIGEYTTSGATVNASLVSGLSGPIGIVVQPQSVPECSTGTLLLSGLASLAFFHRRKIETLN